MISVRGMQSQVLSQVPNCPLLISFHFLVHLSPPTTLTPAWVPQSTNSSNPDSYFASCPLSCPFLLRLCSGSSDLGLNIHGGQLSQRNLTLQDGPGSGQQRIAAVLCKAPFQNLPPHHTNTRIPEWPSQESTSEGELGATEDA